MRRLTISAAIAAVLAVLIAPAAEARPRLAGVFDLSGTPGQIARGPDGNMWVPISNSSDNKTLAKITPSGTVTEYDPPNVVNPIGIAPGQDGNLWFTRNGGVAWTSPADPDNTSNDFAIQEISDPRRITRGPNGLLWTASADQIVSFAAAEPPTDVEAKQVAGMSGRGIAGSGGRVWVADFTGRIVRYIPGGAVKPIQVGGSPQEVARGPRGSVAYTNQGTDPHTVGLIDRTGKVRKRKVPDTDPFGVTFAPDRNFWIANFASHDMTILPREGKPRRFRKLPDNSGPRWVAVGKPKTNTLWVSLEQANAVARIKGVRR